MPDIVSLGECMVELYGDKPLAQAECFYKSYAGDTLNMIAMASRLGTPCGYVTRVGDDPFAEYLLGVWRDLGIDTSRVKVVPGFNAVHFTVLMPDGDREFVYYRKGSAASLMEPGDLDPDYIGGARIFHTSAITQAVSASCRRTALEAARLAKERGVAVSFDTNLRLNLWTAQEAREAFEEILPYVDMVFPSYPAETQALLGVDLPPEEVIELLLGRGVRVVGLKCGRQGAWVGSREAGIACVPGVAPKGVVDSTGAGDAFVGGLLHRLLEGDHLFEAARWGVVAAGLKLAGRGGARSQPSREEVLQHLDATRPEPVG